MDVVTYANEIHKPVKRKFDRRSVLAVSPNDIWSIDLLDVANIKEDNDNVTFLLIIVDVYSRYAYAFPLKSKTPRAILNVMRSMKDLPNNIWTDEGKEFYNKEFAKFCKEHDINHYHTFSGIKSAFAERFNRTLREMMYRYFTENNTDEYLNVLDDFIKEYNNRVHSRIKQTPKNVYQGKAKPYKPISFINSEPKYKVGDFVRVSKVKKTFEKGYTARWSKEVFKVDEVDTSRYPTMYQLEDLQGESIDGKFYEDEMQSTNLKDFALVEKILDRKTVKRKKFYLVKYDGYGEKFNEWISEQQLEQLRPDIHYVS
jgi:hypothetical protein